MTDQNVLNENVSDPEQAAKKRRARQTQNNLMLSLLACFALVFAVVLMVPRDESNRIKPVDYVTTAQAAAQSSGKKILVPELINDKWWANSARWNSVAVDGVQNWYVGFVGPKNQYLGLTQAFDANPTWLAIQLKDDIQNGTITIAGRTWQVYVAAQPGDTVKTKDYALSTEVNNDLVILYGTAGKAEFRQFAKIVGQQIEKIYQ
jgi:hypothetical protein